MSRDYEEEEKLCIELETVTAERDSLQHEVEHLMEVVAAKPLEDGKTVRVEMNTNSKGHPCLIVTAPMYFEEERLAKEIAAVMNLWLTTADYLQIEKSRKELSDAKALAVSVHEILSRKLADGDRRNWL